VPLAKQPGRVVRPCFNRFTGGFIMQFALLVSQLPHVEEARNHYNEMLSLQPRHYAQRTVAALRAALQILKAIAH
jgi:hypothetical protein